MKLALLGYPIQHSLSPSLYQEFLGDQLASYELLEIPQGDKLPDLKHLATRFDGLNITSPYKSHYTSQVLVTSQIALDLNAVNTISFAEGAIFGTNTDALAVEILLKDFVQKFGSLQLVILGDGVMSRMTKLIAQTLDIETVVLSRKLNGDIFQLDLRKFHLTKKQTIIINSCHRDFTFTGQLHPQFVFWDYNYAFLPHQNTLPSLVQEYIDGLGLLRLQACEAVRFWSQTNSKLKC